MKNLLITTIAAVVLVGCGESQSLEPPTAKAPDISIDEAAGTYKMALTKSLLEFSTKGKTEVTGTELSEKFQL